jgi:glutathionylspermidine synthase
VEFRNFLYEFNSFIELPEYGAKVTITGSKFTNMNTCGAILRNRRPKLVSRTISRTDHITAFTERATNYPYYLLSN